MKRLTMEGLEVRAFARRREIEFDGDIAVVTIGRQQFYANVPARSAREEQDAAWATYADADGRMADWASARVYGQ